MRPRKVFIVVGALSVLLAAVVLYVNYFGTSRIGLENNNSLVSPYQAVAEKIFENMATWSSAQVGGEMRSDFFTAAATATLDLTDKKILKINLLADLIFTDNTFKAELIRIAPEDFYFYVSQANLSPDIKELVADLLNKWIKARSNLAQELAPEEFTDINFDEARFLEKLRLHLQKNPPINLTKKLENPAPDLESYEYVITPAALARFLGNLFGDLYGQQLSKEDLLALEESLFDYNFSGEVLVSVSEPNIVQLQEFYINWSNLIEAHFLISDINQPAKITRPEKAVDLEKLLR